MFIDENMLESTENIMVDTKGIHKITVSKFRKAANSKCFSDEDIQSHFKFMAGMLKSKSEDLFRIVREERPQLIQGIFMGNDYLPDEVA